MRPYFCICVQATAKKKAWVGAPATGKGGKQAASREADEHGSSGPVGSVSTADQWLPRARLLTARFKLSRVNPATIMALDVLQNALYVPAIADRSHPARYEALLGSVRAVISGGGSWPPSPLQSGARRKRALPENNVPVLMPAWQRTLLEAALAGPLTGNASPCLDVAVTLCPDVAAQVDCLLDLATDPNVLVRQWVGLATWC